MKRILMIFIIISITLLQNNLNADDNRKCADDMLRRSSMNDSGILPNSSSFPLPFNKYNNPVTSGAVSTGYYFVDSDDQAPEYWRPNPNITDTNSERNLWRLILPGPRLRDPAYWANSPDGYRFFRNPALPLPSGDFFNGATDSTDDAIAGPIPIGFAFYFNGLKYDSFYVSTNGIIALTNDRYFYDSQKNRIIPRGASTCYNPMSMDWFYPGRRRNGNGLNDPVSDDFGYYYSVCGGNPMNPQGGIRSRGSYSPNSSVLNVSQFSDNKSAIIAPFWGDLHLSNYNKEKQEPEDWGRVLFKRSNNADKLVIYYIHAAPVRRLYTPYDDLYGQFDF